MDKLAKLVTDICKLWEHYAGAYFTGIQNTLILAVAATLAGWYKNPPTPKLPVPAPYRREDMITAHLKLYHELCLS